ncbi:MAG TPA: lactate utilization protein [Dongiaceae bacterium]|nr:lactate utilization protein [Dongiaceae bacterium]
MSARDDILNRIRAGRGEATAHPGPGLTPKRGQVVGAERKALFVKMAQQALASVDEARSRAEVPGLVKSYLSQHNLPAEARLAPDPRITGLDWASQPLLSTSVGGTDGSHPISVTGCFAGVAETGTIALTSGAPSPTLLNFLPETHIVVVDAKDLAGTYEDLWARLKGQYGETMPRTLNLVTGPSRSGDIEQTILMGAHGPKRLHIILVDEP